MSEITHSTFGIEFESNIIFPDDSVDSHISRRHSPLNSGWNSQDDPTTAIEINTPVYHSIKEAVESISEQFKMWHKERECAFYAYNANRHVDESLTSSGQHIHIGVTPRRYSGLNQSTKDLFSKHLRTVYPLLMAISAQPTPSNRMLTSGYCFPLTANENCLPDDDNNHDQELNYSGHGTVECRIFDTNIPQCSLSEAWILTKMLDHIRRVDRTESEHNDITFSKAEYIQNRKLASTQGFASLPITQLLNRFNSMLSEENLNEFETESIREIWFLMAKYALSPSDIYHIVKPKRYSYFKIMFENPDKYLANLLEISDTLESIKFVSILRKMQTEAKTIKSFEQLIKLSEAKPTVSFKAKAKVEKPEPPQVDYTDTIKKLLENNRYEVKRMTELEDFTLEEIAGRIETIMLKEPNSLINRMASQEIIGANERFYVLTVDIDSKKQVLGAVALRVRTGEVMHLIVKDNYKRLGIGTKLLNYIVDMSKETEFDKLIAFIRRQNTPSERLFSKFGFEINNHDREETEEQKRSNRYELKISEVV